MLDCCPTGEFDRSNKSNPENARTFNSTAGCGLSPGLNPRFCVVIIPHFCDKTKNMNQSFAPEDSNRFQAALLRFDQENSRDPNVLTTGGKTSPRELVYAQWLSEWVLRLNPNASEALRLAARSAHLCRWVIARDSYPMTRPGYLHWRQELKAFHAQKVGAILHEAG